MSIQNLETGSLHDDNSYPLPIALPITLARTMLAVTLEGLTMSTVTTMPRKTKIKTRKNPFIPEMRPIGHRLKAARERAKLSQAALAEKLGTSSQDLGQVENGWRAASVPRLARMADAVGVTLEWLLTGIDPALYARLIKGHRAVVRHHGRNAG